MAPCRAKDHIYAKKKRVHFDLKVGRLPDKLCSGQEYRALNDFWSLRYKRSQNSSSVSYL